MCHVKEARKLTEPTRQEPNQVDEGAEMVFCDRSMFMTKVTDKSPQLQNGK